MNIHPTAQIAATAKLGGNVSVGPYAIIEDDVEIGDFSQIDGHAVVRRYVKMGQHNWVHPHAVLGGLPQDLTFERDSVTWLEIGDGNVFREGVTVSRASQTVTRIGSHCYLMNNSHVAHDCRLGDFNILAANVALGGHVVVGNRVFFGGASVVHQFCRIGSFAMIRGMAGVNKDVLPYSLVGGAPIKHYRLNSVGLHRNGIEGDAYLALSSAYRSLRLRESIDELPDTEELAYLRAWLAEPSKRGLAGFVALSVKTDDE
ncbi:MAG: acyl-ACP--UDP-N-acetylglucosamine O-acyltransferase [Methylococcaceae bacterium]|nr:MAG: acyl-ACP--UDP-N-acetylglucosamine O-acyltransferase [Methylococcaceae bacterium]